ncbi:hypothetical protein HYW44_03925 [Candidatus Daviesbacteria bacterium]|nr:hypothetical protein [Candidatus Daviesbacteria bacterium]
MNLKPLAVYLIAIFTLSIFLYLFLKNYSSTNYSKAKKEELLSAPSKFKLNTGDPCMHSVYGDPAGVQENYIKINLHCSKSNSSTNTLALEGISPDTYSGALYLLANVNVFEAGVIPERIDKLGNLISDNNQWRCFIGQNREIKNFNEKLKQKDTINCFYEFSFEDVKKYYENN